MFLVVLHRCPGFPSLFKSPSPVAFPVLKRWYLSTLRHVIVGLHVVDRQLASPDRQSPRFGSSISPRETSWREERSPEDR